MTSNEIPQIDIESPPASPAIVQDIADQINELLLRVGNTERDIPLRPEDASFFSVTTVSLSHDDDGIRCVTKNAAPGDVHTDETWYVVDDEAIQTEGIRVEYNEMEYQAVHEYEQALGNWYTQLEVMTQLDLLDELEARLLLDELLRTLRSAHDQLQSIKRALRKKYERNGDKTEYDEDCQSAKDMYDSTTQTVYRKINFHMTHIRSHGPRENKLDFTTYQEKLYAVVVAFVDKIIADDSALSRAAEASMEANERIEAKESGVLNQVDAWRVLQLLDRCLDN